MILVQLELEGIDKLEFIDFSSYILAHILYTHASDKSYMTQTTAPVVRLNAL